MRRVFDYSEYGGAPLLGINGNCIISHGKSSAKAINNAVKIAVEMVCTDAKGHIERRIAGNQQEIIGR
jgi:glycerol-3-phosphate acyltransferase PlsX